MLHIVLACFWSGLPDAPTRAGASATVASALVSKCGDVTRIRGPAAPEPRRLTGHKSQVAGRRSQVAARYAGSIQDVVNEQFEVLSRKQEIDENMPALRHAVGGPRRITAIRELPFEIL